MFHNNIDRNIDDIIETFFILKGLRLSYHVSEYIWGAEGWVLVPISGVRGRLLWEVIDPPNTPTLFTNVMKLKSTV